MFLLSERSYEITFCLFFSNIFQIWHNNFIFRKFIWFPDFFGFSGFPSILQISAILLIRLDGLILNFDRMIFIFLKFIWFPDFLRILFTFQIWHNNFLVSKFFPDFPVFFQILKSSDFNIFDHVLSKFVIFNVMIFQKFTLFWDFPRFFWIFS